MGSKRTDRRGFLRGSAAVAGGLTLGVTEPALGQLQDRAVGPREIELPAKL